MGVDVPEPQNKGLVGFYWVVPGTEGEDVVLAQSLALDKAEEYGESLTHPGGHYDFWTKMQCSGIGAIRKYGLSPSVLGTEYEEWPRGRVVFHTDIMRFRLLADKRLQNEKHTAMLVEAFKLPEGHFDVGSDGHYRQSSHYR